MNFIKLTLFIYIPKNRRREWTLINSSLKFLFSDNKSFTSKNTFSTATLVAKGLWNLFCNLVVFFLIITLYFVNFMFLNSFSWIFFEFAESVLKLIFSSFFSMSKKENFSFSVFFIKSMINSNFLLFRRIVPQKVYLMKLIWLFPYFVHNSSIF